MFASFIISFARSELFSVSTALIITSNWEKSVLELKSSKSNISLF